MQRNWDIIRKIMLQIELLPTEDSELNSDEINGIDNDTAAYHMRLLLEAGLIVGGCRNALGPPLCHAIRLTWTGHEFIDSIKRDTVWNKVKETAKVKGMELSFDVIRVAAKMTIESVLGR